MYWKVSGMRLYYIHKGCVSNLLEPRSGMPGAFYNWKYWYHPFVLSRVGDIAIGIDYER